MPSTGRLIWTGNGAVSIDWGGQCTLHEPGPSGWPQLPQGPIAREATSLREDALTANTDSRFSRSWLWHSGHARSVDSRTSSSNSRWHARHSNSNKGMV